MPWVCSIFHHNHPQGTNTFFFLASHRPIRESLRIALIEAGDLERVRQWSLPEDSFSNRVSSLTNASKKFISGISKYLLSKYGQTLMRW